MIILDHLKLNETKNLIATKGVGASETVSISYDILNISTSPPCVIQRGFVNLDAIRVYSEAYLNSTPNTEIAIIELKTLVNLVCKMQSAKPQEQNHDTERNPSSSPVGNEPIS